MTNPKQKSKAVISIKKIEGFKKMYNKILDEAKTATSEEEYGKKLKATLEGFLFLDGANEKYNMKDNQKRLYELREHLRYVKGITDIYEAVIKSVTREEPEEPFVDLAGREYRTVKTGNPFCCGWQRI